MLPFLAPGLQMARGQGDLGSCGDFSTHFLINTETRTFCLQRLELSSRILLLAWLREGLNQRLCMGDPRRRWWRDPVPMMFLVATGLLLFLTEKE